MPTPPKDFAARAAAHFEHMNAAGSPGAAVAVLKDGVEVFSGLYGHSHINSAEPMRRDTIMRIGSQTKQFTVLLALMLEGDGLLSMDDTVQKHLPWVPQFDHPVTLRQLAANASGLRDHLEVLILSGAGLFGTSSRQDARDIVSRQDALNFTPDEAMLYSNTGFFLLGDIIEKVTGKTYNEVLAERITGPLGMKDTFLQQRDSMALPRLATHYTKQPEGWCALGWGFPYGGEGAMVSTLNDMILWMANLDAPKVGTPEMYARMQTPSVFANGVASAYGLGVLADVYRGRRCVGHGGTVAGGKSESERYIDDGLSIVIIANNDQVATFGVGRRIADAWFGDADPAPLPFVPGQYRQVGGPDILALVEHEGGAWFQGAGGPAITLDHGNQQGAKPERAVNDIIVRPGADGSLAALFCGTPRQYRPLVAGATAAAPLAGRYANAAQGFDVEVTGDTRSGTFTLRSPLGVTRATLLAIDSDLWVMLPPGGTFDLGQPWTGTLIVTPTGFELNTDRIKRLAFTKQ